MHRSLEVKNVWCNFVRFEKRCQVGDDRDCSRAETKNRVAWSRCMAYGDPDGRSAVCDYYCFWVIRLDALANATYQTELG